MKQLLALLVIVALGLGGAAFWVSQRGKAAPPPPKREAVDRGDLVEKVSATGKLLFKGIFLVATEVPAARVVEICPGADVGQRVAKDQPLLRLDDELGKARLEEALAAVHAADASLVQAQAKKASAQAQVRLAQASVDLANKELERARKYTDQVGIDKKEAAEKAVTQATEGIALAQAQVKEADSAIMTAQANIERAKAGERVARQALDLCLVKAPAAGVILERRVVKGQLVAAQATPVLFTLAPDLNQLEMIAQVGEGDTSKIRKGQKVTFTVDAYSDEATFTGEVVRVADIPTTTGAGKGEGLAALAAAGQVFFAVYIDVVPLESRPLKAGFTANVEFVVRKVTGVQRVPNQALNYRPEPVDPEEQKQITDRAAGNWKPLWVYHEGGKAQLVFIRTGATDGTRTEIAEVADGVKLPEGTELIIEAAPPEKGGLFDGAPKLRL